MKWIDWIVYRETHSASPTSDRVPSHAGVPVLVSKPSRSLPLSIDRGGVQKTREAECGVVDLAWILYTLPSIEVVSLQGIPPLELSLIIGFLSRVAMFKLPCHNLK